MGGYQLVVKNINQRSLTMPHDYNDNLIKVGDRVTIEFEVTDLFPNETHINARLKSVIPNPDTYTRFELWGINTHITQLSRPSQIIMDEEMFMDGCCILNDQTPQRLPARATRTTHDV